ncbi:tetratricopeptide repeat protein [Thiocystis violacea]|uniref:tetratricopeptide repeat protein n=1 Tax=Thiocystis violacea TaxID=13725 RepID=UPI0031F9BD51
MRVSICSGLLVIGVGGCVNTQETSDVAGIEPIAPGRGVDDYVLVDCLLPGQIRQLGTRMTYLAPRRMVKSTKSDCGIRGGEFVLFDRSDYGSALQALLPKAQGGDPVAQTYVGEIYEKGLGLSAPDYANAASWYQRAAVQSHSPAQTYLGSLYERGLGVPTDKAKALDLYRQASGLTEDRLIFESKLKAERAAFQQEIAVRNRVAASLRTQLRQASASKPSPRKTTSGGGGATRAQLARQAKSQQRDAQSEADRVKKEIHAIEQIKQSDADRGASGDNGKTAQLGKLELTRREQYRSLLDTSRQLSQVD